MQPTLVANVDQGPAEGSCGAKAPWRVGAKRGEKQSAVRRFWLCHQTATSSRSRISNQPSLELCPSPCSSQATIDASTSQELGHLSAPCRTLTAPRHHTQPPDQSTKSTQREQAILLCPSQDVGPTRSSRAVLSFNATLARDNTLASPRAGIFHQPRRRLQHLLPGPNFRPAFLKIASRYRLRRTEEALGMSST